MRTLLAVCAIALAGAALVPADEWNHKTTVTFNRSVALPAVHQPGMEVLPPGTYVFKLLDSASNRHIVQIFNEDQTELYATILAIPNMRLRQTDKVVITFRETRAGLPFELRAIFYPGSLWGEEFVYPKEKAAEIAKVVNEPVLSAPIKEEEAMPESPDLIAELNKAPLLAIAPSGEEVEEAEVVTPPPVEVAGTVPEVLPKTASPLPLAGMLGLLLLAAGTMVGVAARRLR